MDFGSLTRRTALRFGVRSLALTNLARAQFHPEWTTGKLAVPGGNVVSRTYGGGPKAPVLMVHGGPSGADSRPYAVLSALGNERRLISWDQLDCGDSDHPNDPANWRHTRFAEEVNVVRNKLVPGPVHILGGSWGSTLAMEWLVTKRPSDVLSVTFFCPGLDYRRTEASRRAAQKRLSPESSAVFDQLERAGKVPGASLAAANAEYLRTYVMRNPQFRELYGRNRPHPAMMRALFVDWHNWSRVSEFSALKPPVLLIRGEYDYITDEDLAFYAAARPGTEVAVIPEAAHLAFLDNPNASVDVLRRFWSRAER